MHKCLEPKVRDKGAKLSKKVLLATASVRTFRSAWHLVQVAGSFTRQPARRAAASSFLWPTIGIPPLIISEAAGFDSPVGRADYLIKLL